MQKLRIDMRSFLNNNGVGMDKTLFIVFAMFMVAISHASVCIPDELDFPVTKKELRFVLSPSTNCNALGLKVSDKEHAALWARVSGMKHLESLWVVYEDPDADLVRFPVDQLSSLTNLTTLCIVGDVEKPVEIPSLGALSRVPVESLELCNVVLRDTESIGALKKLNSLKTSEPRIIRCAPANLEALHIERASFSGCCSLSRLTNLVDLAICGLNARCLTLGKMERLESLYIRGLSADFYEEEIAACTNLTSLTVRGECGSAYGLLEALQGLPLERLEIEMLPIRELRGLEKSRLKEMIVRDCPLVGISSICSLPRLERLDVCGTGISSCSRELRKELRRKFPKLTFFQYWDEKLGCVDVNPQLSISER